MSHDTMTFGLRNGLALPLKTKRVRFAIERKNGLTSNAWAVCVENTGDAYIYCRDNMKEQKVSLHASGKQHISFSQESVARVSSTGDRFMNQWWEPQHADKVVPTLRLLFPTWGLSLNNQQRAKFQTLWDKNDIWIPAHDEMVTVVSFLIIDNGTILRKEEAWPPAAVIGILKLRPGKSLFVIAGYEPEGDLRKKVENALRKISVTTDPTLLEGKDLALCFTGWYQDNSAYMLPVSARYDPLAQPDSI